MLVAKRKLAAVCLTVGLTALGIGMAAGETVRIPASIFTPPDSDTALGGSAGAKVVLPPNLPLLERVLLSPQDLREAAFSVTLAPAPAGLAEVLARGKATHGDTVSLDQQASLQSIVLGEKSRLAITVWRHQFHWHGGAELRALKIQRLADGSSADLPAFTDQSAVQTELGAFRLCGYANRDKFPVLAKRGEVARGAKPGTWEVQGGKTVNFTATPQSLHCFTLGRADWSAGFDWAPVLVFEPKAAGAYRLTGTLAFQSGQAADKSQAQTLSWMVLSFSEAKEKPVAAQLEVHRLLRPLGSAAPAKGVDFDARPIATAALDQVLKNQRQKVEIEGLAPILAEWMSQPRSAHGLLLTLAPQTPGSGPLPTVMLARNAMGEMVIEHHPAHELFDHAQRPREGVYAALRDGHLFYGDQRLRLWGVVGSPDPQRIRKMGFNAERVWNPSSQSMYDADSAKRGEVKPYVQGDGSRWDLEDRHFAELKQAGLFVMFAALGHTMPLKLVAVDGAFVAEGDDWPKWKAAVTGKEVDEMRWVFFDERLQAIRKQHLKNLLAHVNPYTGKAYGQDEAIVIYELFNENGGAKRLLEGCYEKWPAYFRDKLARKWNAWLKARYPTDAAVTAAWGKLAAGESLSGGTVALGPTWQKHGEAPKARGNDFVRFVLELIDHYHQDMRSYCRTLAPKGVGVNVAPFSFDTQYIPSLAWSYLQGRGEVHCPGMYFFDLQSTLDKPPSAYVIDSPTVDGCATVLYETNAGRPGPYRAEYPLKLAALAGWQDWDGVIWHYWAAGGRAIDEAYLAGAMLPPHPHHYWNAVHHENDPVMCSSMALAGRMFLGNRIRPAPQPAVIRVGAEGLFSYDYHWGVGQAQQTFRTGARLRFEPNQPGGASVDGKPLAEPRRLTEAVAAGEEILWDWPNGRLILDTPTVHAYAGRIGGPYRFKDGIVLGDVGAPFVSFAMVSADGKPLAGDHASRRIYLSAVSDAKNTGFEMDGSVKGGPLEQAKAIRNAGRAPVVVDRVPYSVWFPTQLEGRFEGYDFALRKVVNQSVSATNRVAHDGRELFLGVLAVESRGAAADVPAAAGTTVRPTAAGSSEAASQAAGAGPWNPIPGLGWEVGYDAAHKALRAATFALTSISQPDRSQAPEKTIHVGDVQVPGLWKAPADLELAFQQDRLRTITVTFKQPPPFAGALADYEKQFGPAAEKKLAAQYETSVAHWPAQASRPGILMTESQGIFKIVYSFPP